jgi:hypothetical protein
MRKYDFQAGDDSKNHIVYEYLMRPDEHIPHLHRNTLINKNEK